MNKLAYLIVCIACISLTECKTSSKTAQAVVTKPATAEAKPTPTPAADPIAIGQSIYQSKCADCHKLPRPGDYDQADWAHIIVKMSHKAHLSEEETTQVLAYVNANAKQL